jgi:hypothetical protein
LVCKVRIRYTSDKGILYILTVRVKERSKECVEDDPKVFFSRKRRKNQRARHIQQKERGYFTRLGFACTLGFTLALLDSYLVNFCLSFQKKSPFSEHTVQDNRTV